MLEDRAGTDVASLSQTADALVLAASKRPELANMISTFRTNVPAYTVKLDPAKLETLNVPISDAYQAVQAFVGGLYANDFNAFGHTWQVVVQADQEFRSKPEDINRFCICAQQGRQNECLLGPWHQSPRPRDRTSSTATTASAQYRFWAGRLTGYGG